ncbi:Uncharacterized conserved protein, DUF305 family [Micromonospora viridifaciens]|uniref:Uncharacterized conserved protein, DUF305 family n=1 Tax=Micromonospora viridifaciens TaxID=1881 RepID=A0A1C4VDW4_MICVI|nr:DUF305 domain-containing protein [Micromonospora viridifaciens]SCE82132.1 Uncharacterized conserved protein, DUF305 family [Micromonospora viridifaciens]
MTAAVTTDTELDEAEATDDGGRRAARRFGTLALAAAVVVGLLLGYAGGLLTPTFTRPGNNSVEAGFARDMTTHHAQAVEMGMMAFQQGQDLEVRQIGGDIATGQQGEIGTMQTWLRSWKLDPTGDQPPMAWMSDGPGAVKNGLMPGMATPEEMKKLRAAQGREFDVLFLKLMIQHHLGGVHMIQGVLAEGHDEDVLAVAQIMKNTQQTDLTNLQAALKRLGG